MKTIWVDPTVRDSVVEYVHEKKRTTAFTLTTLLLMIGIDKSKYYAWKLRVGIDNQHNCNLPKSNRLLAEEKKAVIAYAKKHYADNDYYLRDGYRRLTYRMLDEDIAAVSPSSVYRILQSENLLNKWNTAKVSAKGNGFTQPRTVHEHWHTDIKYINVRGSFIYLISVMDGYSRSIIHHEVRLCMAEYDVQLTIQRAKEKYPNEHPRIISDNGGQFISKDFQKFIRAIELTHVKTSIAYPQSNGKLERFHRSIGMECLRTKSFLNIEDARILIAQYIEQYNTVRLHSSLLYLTPEDVLLGRVKERTAVREEKIKNAIEKRLQFWNAKQAA